MMLSGCWRWKGLSRVFFLPWKQPLAGLPWAGSQSPRCRWGGCRIPKELVWLRSAVTGRSRGSEAPTSLALQPSSLGNG